MSKNKIIAILATAAAVILCIVLVCVFALGKNAGDGTGDTNTGMTDSNTAADSSVNIPQGGVCTDDHVSHARVGKTIGGDEQTQIILGKCSRCGDEAGEVVAALADMTGKTYMQCLTEFSQNAAVIEAKTTKGTARSTWIAEYTESGIVISVRTYDPISYTASGKMDKSDNISFYIQAANSIECGDGFAISFSCNAEGEYALQRYSSTKGYVAESVSDITTENDRFYYDFEKIDGGYDVKVFASYAFLNSTYESAHANIRIFPMLRNADASGMSVCSEYCEELGALPSRPDTWFVIDEDGSFIRDDFDKVSFAEDTLESSGHTDLKFLEELAVIEGGTLRKAEIGMPMFTDRGYSFEEYSLPTELLGKSYLQNPISGCTVTVKQAGYVVLMTNQLSGNESRDAALASSGWKQLIYAARTPGNISATSEANQMPDMANWYVKYCQAGESVTISKWGVAFGAESSSTKAVSWHTTPANIITDITEYYTEAERQWQGIPTIEVTNGGRIIAGWNSGDKGEPRIGNYAYLMYSDDNGETWKDLFAIDTVPSTDASKSAKVLDVQLWLDRDTNKLYVFYMMSGTGSWLEKNCAVWMFTVSNPDEAVDKWNISEHKYAFPGLLRNDILVLDDGSWLAAPTNFMDERLSGVYISSDKGATWTLQGQAYIPQATNHDETILTQLTDGSIWMTVRTTYGKVYQAFSSDKGATWSLSSATDIPNAKTRFSIERLSSGALLMIYNNNSTTSRVKMTAALSYDDGKTWKYSMVLYTYNSTYPDVSVTSDGKIHVIFDHSRFNETPVLSDENGEYWAAIYHVVLTEDLIKENSGKTYDIKNLNMISCLRKASVISNTTSDINGTTVAPDGTKVSGVTVSVNGQSVVSDQNGSFKLSSVKSGSVLTLSANGYYTRTYTVSDNSFESADIVMVPDNAVYFGKVGGNNSTVTFSVYGLRYSDGIRFIGIAGRPLVATDKLELYSNVYSFLDKRTEYTAYTTFIADGTIAMKNFPGGTAGTHPNTDGVSSSVYNDTIVGYVPYTAWDALCPDTYNVSATTPIGLTFLSMNGGTSDPWTASELGITLDSTPTKKDSRTFIIWNADDKFYPLSVAAGMFGLVVK